MLSRTYLVLGACVAIGAYWIDGRDHAATSAPSAPRTKRAATLPAFTTTPGPSLAEPMVEELLDDEAIEAEEEAMRGHAPIEDPGELAFVFSVEGTSYMRLSTEERATVRGTPKLFEDDGVFSVVAPVATTAMPAHLRAWAGRTVLVDGTCRARVVGFAEVSRVSGDPEDPWDYETNEPRDVRWSVDSVTDDGVVLAGKLDGCDGTWARSEHYAPAAVVAKVDAPALETAALADLLARGEDDPTQQDWAQQGGEGDWRDAADVVAQVYLHPLTNERWVFVQARHPGSCGEPSFGLMAAYRSHDGETVRRVADLEFGHDHIRDVVDLDGDGQPELVLGDGERAELVDLTNERHGSTDVPYYHHGCGC